MAAFVIKGRPVWLGAIDMSASAHAVAIDYGAEPADNTTLNSTTRKSIGGLKTFGFSMDAFVEPAIVDGLLTGYVGSEVPLTFATVTGAGQEDAYLINARQLAHSPFSGAIGDIAKTNISGNASGDLVRGILEVNTATATTGNSAGVELGAISATQSLHINLHVTVAAGTTLDVIVQSDTEDTFASAITVATFTQVTGITSQHIEVVGANTDRFFRIRYTIVGGSFTFAAAFGVI